MTKFFTPGVVSGVEGDDSCANFPIGVAAVPVDTPPPIVDTLLGAYPLGLIFVRLLGVAIIIVRVADGLVVA